MDLGKYHEIMKERERIWADTQDNWYDGIQMCAEQMSELIKADIPGFIQFLYKDCSSHDFLYITDMLDKIFSDIRSQSLADAFRDVLKTRFRDEESEYSISRDIDEAVASSAQQPHGN